MSRTKSTPSQASHSLKEALAAEWHPTLNEPLTPFDVRPRGNASVWWRCRFGHEWKAKVAPRAVGVGCPQCSIIGVSERQIRLAFELAAAGLPVEHDYPPIPVDGRRSIRADIVMPSLRLVVEYDGSYYNARKAQAAREQTAALESVGWSVVRVREQPLPTLGGHEIFVDLTEPIKSVAIKVLNSLAGIGHAALHRSDYVRDPDMWAERAANDALYKYRAKSLASEFPDVAKEFHPDKNDGVAPNPFTREARRSSGGFVLRVVSSGSLPCGSAQPAIRARAVPTCAEPRNGLYPRRGVVRRPVPRGGEGNGIQP